MLDRLDHVASLPACTSQKGAGLWLSCSELDHVSGSITLLPQERCSPGTCVHSKCRTPPTESQGSVTTILALLSAGTGLRQVKPVAQKVTAGK